MDSGEKTATLQNPKIYAAIAGVISDCGFVSKDKVNKQQGFKYRIETDLGIVEYACRKYVDCDDDEITFKSEGGMAYADTSAAEKVG